MPACWFWTSSLDGTPSHSLMRLSAPGQGSCIQFLWLNGTLPLTSGDGHDLVPMMKSTLSRSPVVCFCHD